MPDVPEHTHGHTHWWLIFLMLLFVSPCSVEDDHARNHIDDLEERIEKLEKGGE